ncbi:Eco47II family restriction endonuclease [Empedobacter stercoris]|uniref:Eco47II family restriction endonuclease n=1 Tax=Empedobacter stercoris TaxID=1628248 RepID=A0ABX1WPP3_9FLAO|nr:Eco47II family restriction endonuclease [Empedobacter stercoris]MCA4776570.1 Eco47II family restriction endonuclease [Empedobacter stercoris]MCA4810522.1 Eco47II family restriction endonuclease [Empedobacter stercoris]NOJ76646.1 Eco47II family restriction endonuclease [Empedobacter stercoris]QNT13846.1 Eco47II family restriction endonuclease [Empedobacter stercoris]
MANKYVNFISDEHLLNCVENLHKSYLKAKNNISKKSFYTNKVDTIKLTFDAKFNDINEEDLIQSEILRQIDKSINNSIGTFHEQILGGIESYEVGKLSGFDIKATDNTLFADIKNKHNTMNSSSAEALFQKLARYADDYKKAKCYWVQILAKSSFNEHWKGEINGKEYSHSRVFKISGDQFYALLSGQNDALFQLYKALPIAINDYLNSIEKGKSVKKNSALDEITSETEKSKRSILNQITFENYSYYLGFDKL